MQDEEASSLKSYTVESFSFSVWVRSYVASLGCFCGLTFVFGVFVLLWQCSMGVWVCIIVARVYTGASVSLYLCFVCVLLRQCLCVCVSVCNVCPSVNVSWVCVYLCGCFSGEQCTFVAFVCV